MQCGLALPLGNPLTQGAESFFFWVWVSWRLWPASHARGLRHHIRTDGSPEVRVCACQMAWPAEALEMTGFGGKDFDAFSAVHFESGNLLRRRVERLDASQTVNQLSCRATAAWAA